MPAAAMEIDIEPFLWTQEQVDSELFLNLYG